MKIGSWFRKLGHAMWTGLRRFPAAVLLATAVTFVLLWLNHRETFMTDAALADWRRALAVCIMGFPLVLSLHLLLERMQRPPAYKPAGWGAAIALFLPVAAGLVAYAWFLLPEFETVPLLRLVMLTAAFVLLFVMLPYWWRREGLALHATRLMTRLLVTVLYAGILMLALFAILFTLENLLNVHIVDDHYADTAILVWALFAPLFFLAGIPGVREVPKQEDSPKTLRFLLHWILIPLLWVYTGILYVYSAKILWEQEWPRGMVSSLILAYLCVGLLVWLLSAPVKGDTKLAGFHHRAFPWAALPLFGILFAALFLRIGEYGFTEERWFAFALAIWCAFAVLFLSVRGLVRKKDPEAAGLRLIVLPLSLALVAVSTVIGPCSAFEMSIRSQNHQLEALFERNGMLTDGQAQAAGGAVPQEDVQRIASILYWFDDTHGLDAVQSLGNVASLKEAETRLALTLSETDANYRYRYVSYLSEDMQAPLDISGYDLMFSIGYDEQAVTDPATGITFRMNAASRLLSLERDGLLLQTLDMSDMFHSLLAQYGDGGSLGEVRLPASAMAVEGTDGNLRTKLVLRRLSGNAAADGTEGKPGNAEGWWLVDLP